MKSDTASNVPKRSLEIIRSFSEAWQRGDLAVAGSFLADDVEWYDQAAIPDADLHRGPEAVRHHWQQWLEPWREADYAMEELLDYGGSNS
jgi:ketosteroid isomerase-like protein